MKQFLLTAVLFCIPVTVAAAQDETAEPSVVENGDVSAGETETPPVAESEDSDADTLEKAKESASGLVNDAKDLVEDLTSTLDKNRTVQDASTGILHPIYVTAKALAFPTFHGLAFGLMVAGVVSYALQLVLGKLVVLTQGSINIREIISDFVGLFISAIGLVLTTQAATENSTFPESSTGVLSATVLGAVAGLILYRWNQAEEVDAARGKQRKKKKNT